MYFNGDNMTNLKKIFICLILCLITFGLACCSNAKIDAPAQSDAVVGNGGSAVIKGEYLYFTNGYISNTTITDSNRTDSYVNSGLYVTKLVNNELVVDDNGAIEDYELLYDKITGFEQGGLYIFGEYIYFTTPCTQKNTEGEVANDLLVFKRLKLDKSSDAETLYTTKVAGEDVQYMYYGNGSVVYLLLHENDEDEINTLTRIQISSKVTTALVDSDITSIVLPTERDNTEQATFLNDRIFYTKALTEDEGETYEGNKMYQYNVATNVSTQIKGTTITDTQYTYKVLAFLNDTLYYEMQDDIDTCIYNAVVTDGTLGGGTRLTNTSTHSYTKFLPIKNTVRGLNVLVCATSSAVHALDNFVPSVILSDNANTLFVNDHYLFYYQNGNIYRVTLDGNDKGTNEQLTNFESEEVLFTSGIDFDDKYVYYYLKVESGAYYLHRTDITNPNVDDFYSHEMVGIFATADIPEEE